MMYQSDLCIFLFLPEKYLRLNLILLETLMRNPFILLSFERAISVPLGENGAVTMSREIFNPIWPCLQTRTHTDKWWERKQDSNFLVFTLPHA